MSNEELVKEIQSGQNREDNLIRLWESNQGLIRLVIKKFAAAGEWEDLQQEGYLALHRAVFAYDPARGASFSTALYKWLYQDLSRYADGNGAVQLSAGARQAVRAYQKMESSFVMQLSYQLGGGAAIGRDAGSGREGEAMADLPPGAKPGLPCGTGGWGNIPL